MIFLTLGIVLETLHGFKSSYYLDTRNVTRRLMWTLAHTHGTLFSLVNVAFALCVSRLSASPERRLSLTSLGLTGALFLMPLGFFLGGLKLYGGDPGPGILLVPIGAIMLLAGVALFTVELIRSRSSLREDRESRNIAATSSATDLSARDKKVTTKKDSKK